MSKRINFGTINDTFLNALSRYNMDLHDIDTLKKTHTETLARLTKVRDDIKAERDAFIEENPETTIQQLDEKFANLPKAIRDIQDENKKYAEELKGYNDSIKTFIDTYLVNEDFYDNYKNYMSNHNDTKLKASYRDFFVAIGASNADNETAINNTVKVLVDMIGVRMCNASNKKGEWNYIKTLSKTVYHKTFMSVLLHYLVNEKGVLTVNDDNSIIMTVYED